MEEVREHYELVVADDKDMDKLFKKEFADCEPYVDPLYKLFKKRPRGHKQKVLDTTDTGPVKPSNVFAGMLSVGVSSGGAKRGGEGGGGMESVIVMVELDHISHMPEGLDFPTWERFVAHRHKKVESESKV